MLQARLRTASKIGAIVYLAYLALVLLVLTPALNLAVPALYKKQTGATLHTGNILLNPFTLALLVQPAQGDNADGSRFWSFDKLRVNVSVASLWRGHPVLDEIHIDALQVQVDQLAPDRYNFTAMIEHGADPTAAPADESGTTTAIEIGRLHLHAKQLGLRAPHFANPFDLRWQDLTLTVENLSTVAPDDAAAADLPALAIGSFGLDSGRVDFKSLRPDDPFSTHLEAFHLVLKNFSTIAKAGQPYRIEAQDEGGGSLRWHGDVSVAAQSSSGELELRQISLLPVWRFLAPQLAFDAQSALLDARGRYSLHWGETLRYRIEQGALGLNKVQLRARNDANSAIGLGALRIEGISVDSATQRIAAGTATIDGLAVRGWNEGGKVSLVDMFALPPDDEPGEETAPWQIDLADIQLRNGRVDWRASQLDVPALAITPINARIAGLQWPASAPFALEFDAALNEDTRANVRGELSLADMSGQLGGDINALPLAWGNKLLGDYLRASIADGRLSTQWQAQLAKGELRTLRADGRVDNFALMPGKGRRLAAWRSLQWQQLALDMPAQRLQLHSVNIAEPAVRFRLNPDGTNNFQSLMKEQKTASSASEGITPTSEKPGAAKPEWSIAIDNIRAEKGTVDFRDNSMPHPFSAKIGDFTGTIANLSNAPGQAARVDFRGSLDGYAPVTLAGTVSPLAPQPAGQLALDFTDIDLTTLTPYSGTYGGFAIKRGRMTVQLVYTLQDHRIQGRNHVVIHDLQLGERVESPKALDLPLRLAIALLTDARGVLDLGVDVYGDLSDPNFDLGNIVWGTFRNVITKAVTAPFRLLVKLVDVDLAEKEEQFGVIEFAPGSDELSAEGRTKLAALKEALIKRPTLRLGITGHVNPATDMTPLKARWIRNGLIEQGVSPTDIEQQSKLWQQVVTRWYRQRFPDRSTDLAPQQMVEALRDSLDPKPEHLAALASQRALAVKRALLVELGLPAERVFIEAAGSEQDDAPSAVTLTLEV